VDFSKAFDRVDHNVIVSKLIDRGVPHCLIRWLCSYLNERQQAVRIDGHKYRYVDDTTLLELLPRGSPDSANVCNAIIFARRTRLDYPQ